jgi:cysteine desulfurase / selenocysteine lyase
MTDWNEIRNRYPITHKNCYLKTASIGGMHQDVLAEILKWEKSIAYEGAIQEQRFGDLIFKTRDQVAQFINCQPDHVTLTENTSHNMNILALMLKEEFPKGAEILAPADEFPSSILPFYHHGHEVKQIPSHHGVLTVEHILDQISSKTKAVVCSHIQFLSGWRMDIQRLSKELKKRGLYFFLNATQSLGVFPLDLATLEVAALSATCHKWLGAGMGRSVFYLDSEFQSNHRPPLLGWGSVPDPHAMKNEPSGPRKDMGIYQLGTLPFAALAGVGKAMEVGQQIGLDNISKRVLKLSALLRSQLQELGISPLGNGEPDCSSGTLTFALKADTDTIVQNLSEKNIYVNNRRGLIRASVHFYNNEEDINYFISSLKEQGL